MGMSTERDTLSKFLDAPSKNLNLLSVYNDIPLSGIGQEPVNSLGKLLLTGTTGE